MSDSPDKKPVAVVRPPKPVSQMTPAERRAFAEELAAATVPKIRDAHAASGDQSDAA